MCKRKWGFLWRKHHFHVGGIHKIPDPECNGVMSIEVYDTWCCKCEWQRQRKADWGW